MLWRYSVENYLTERILRLENGVLPHIGVAEGDVNPYVIISGSPARITQFSQKLERARQMGSERGILLYSGFYCGIPVTVAATGMGSPSVAMVVEELIAAGGKVFIRAGSCASIHRDAHIGSLIIATGAVRDEGTSPYYAPLMYPAVADFNVTRALIEAANAQCDSYFLGIIRSTDSFYEGERKVDIIETWRQRNVLAFEMEAAALFTISSVTNCYSGAIVVPGSNLITGTSTYRGQQVHDFAQGVERMITISLDALVLLSKYLQIS